MLGLVIVIVVFIIVALGMTLDLLDLSSKSKSQKMPTICDYPLMDETWYKTSLYKAFKKTGF